MPEVIMPKMGDAMMEGKLLQWTKPDGTVVRPGDIIAEIETDKSNVEIEAEDEGVLKTIASPGETIPVGNVIATIGDSNISAKPAGSAASNNAQAEQQEEPVVTTFREASRLSTGNNGRDVKASPLARRIAREQGIDISLIKGSGPFGRVIEADIAAFLAGQGKPYTEITPSAPPAAPVVPPKPLPAAPIQAVPQLKPAAPVMPVSTTADADAVELSAMRKVIARRMVESKTTIPHFYVTVEIDMTEAVALRERLNAINETSKISINDMVVKAAAKALVNVPAANAAFKDDRIYNSKGVNVGIAVALDDGLIVPVIKNADQLTLKALSQTGKNLIKKARDKKLMPDEYSGGSFTVSNLGAFDVDNFIAIIDPSQGAILAVSSIIRKPVVLDGSDEIVIRQRMNVTFSGDHRVMDGATGAKFTQAIKKYLQNPLSLLE